MTTWLDKHGSAIGTVVGVIACAISLIIGLIVYQSVTTSVNQTGWAAAANTTMTALGTNVYSSFTLLTVSLLVLAAAGIIGVLISYFGLGQGD